MKVFRGYRVELDLNNKQQTLCRRHAGAARYAYNWGLARRIEAHSLGEKAPNYFSLNPELNKLKKGELAWMYEVSKCAPQEALRDLDKAFKGFFERAAKKKQGKLKGKVGFPRFKSRKRGIGSFRLTGTIKVGERHIQLPRLGRLRLKEWGYIPTAGVKILSATVSSRAGRWFVSVQVEIEQPEPARGTGKPVGVDLGVKSMAVTSDGQVFANPKALAISLKKLRRLSRELSRKQKGSKNQGKAKRKLARLHYRISCIRQDALHKATTEIVAKTKPPSERPGVVVVEDLNVAGMVKNRKLARAISEVGFYEFRRQLAYKTKLYGGVLLVADRFYPSSKTCSGCGVVKDELSLSERVYACASCGLRLDRDLNAARNLASLASQVP